MGTEERRLHELEVTVVAAREVFERLHEGGAVCDHPARPAAHELDEVGVALLGHEGAPRREGDGQLQEAELARGEEPEVSAELAEVQGDGFERREIGELGAAAAVLGEGDRLLRRVEAEALGDEGAL